MEFGRGFLSLSGRCALGGRLSIIRVPPDAGFCGNSITATNNQGGTPMTHDTLKWLLSTAAAAISLAFVALLEHL